MKTRYNDQTAVIFKAFKDKNGNTSEVIAIFPGLLWGRTPAEGLTSYTHNGQHGASDPRLIAELPDATPAEFGPLYEELKWLGYHFDGHEIQTECGPRRLSGVLNLNTYELHRNPTRADIARGYGCTIYKDFKFSQIYNPKNLSFKAWTTDERGQRWYL